MIAQLRAASLAVKVGLALAVLVAIIAAWWFLTAPQRAKNAEAGETLAQGRQKAGADAVAIQDGALSEASAHEALTRKNADDIRQAPGADVRLDPGLNDAGRRGLCNRPAYRGSPECVQLLGRPQPSR